jgi:glutamate dehydrogenase (NADP+)
MSKLWTIHRESAKAYADRFGCEWIPDKKPWQVPCDIAMPTAMENELDGNHAQELVKNGCIAVCEGANMPCTSEAAHIFQDSGVLFAPGKAANAGGVATSGLWR